VANYVGRIDVTSKWDTNVFDFARNITSGFLNGRELPDPLSLSALARTRLTIGEKPTDPTAVLNARKKTICSICSTNPQQPIMIEEGTEWEVHQRTRTHRRLLNKTMRRSSPQKLGETSTDIDIGLLELEGRRVDLREPSP